MAPPQPEASLSSAPAEGKRMRTILVLVAFALLSLFGVGLLLAFTASSENPVGAGWFLFSYTMGLTMIVLPCTFPLAFVIVPLSMGKGAKKGFAMALAFGAGVAVTLSLYGVLAAAVGKVAIGTLNAPLETVKNWLYAFAGLFAYLFALGELGFVKVRMPTYSGAAPMAIQRQRDVLKALLLGLFMGNIGVGCPHPATPLILTRIAVSGNVFYGWLLFFVHALGRITPLLLLAILGILGVNALTWITKRRTAIERATGWAMVFVAAFIFVLGFFSHDWWVYSGQHTLLESITQEERYLNLLGRRLGTGNAHHHGIPSGHGLFGAPLWLGNWVLVALWVVPMFWYVRRRQRAALSLAQQEQEKEFALMPWLRAFVVTLTVLIGIVFIWALPHLFLKHTAIEAGHPHGGATHTIEMTVRTDPAVPVPGEPVTLTFTFPNVPLSEFSIAHERFFHLIIVRKDLEGFAHIHPEPVAEMPATFEVTHTFPRSGHYLLATDFVHAGATLSFTRELTIRGNDAEQVVEDLSRVKTFGSYMVRLDVAPEEPVAGEEAKLRWTIMREGKPVTDLEPYLGAPLHIAIVSDDFSSFLHEHGELPGAAVSRSAVPVAFAHEEEGASPHAGHGMTPLPSAFGPTIEANVTFPKPGLYAIFGEFQHEGHVIVTRFLLRVLERSTR